MQRVAVLHLEERCQRAIEWALKIEPSIKHLVLRTKISHCSVFRYRIIYLCTTEELILMFLLQVVSGGVASNKYVRARLDEVVKKNNLHLVCPPPSLCTDNGNSLCMDFLVFMRGRKNIDFASLFSIPPHLTQYCIVRQCVIFKG